MHPNALLELSAELIAAVNQLDAPADSTVSAFFRHHKNLGQRERAILAETVYALLRERIKFQNLAQSGTGSMNRRLAMLAWRGNAAFLRGALSPQEQQWLEQVQAIDPMSLASKMRHNMPEWLAEPLLARLGEAEFWQLAGVLNEAAPLDLRVNALKLKREEAQAQLKAAGIDAVATPYSPLGLRIDGKPALNKLEIFTSGGVEVQDEGSQLLALLLAPKRGEMVVDFCAGAGGKTLALGAAMRNTGRLYAFDVSGHRLLAMKPRLARSGLSNVYPAQIAHERDDRIKRLAGKIDRVLVDAPCSGLGTLRRNPDLKWRQSPQGVIELQAKQRAILAGAARLVKPGGRLVYATCSLLDAENEVIAAEFAAAHVDFRPLDAAEALTKSQVERAGELTESGALRLWPHRHNTDGFFAVAWERAA